MGGHAARDYWEDRGLVKLWTAMLAGPAAFALNHEIGYGLVKWACAADATYVLTLVAAGALVVTVWAAALAGSALRQTRTAVPEGGSLVDRSYFMALVALPLNLLLALLIVLTGIPHFVVSPCT